MAIQQNNPMFGRRIDLVCQEAKIAAESNPGNRTLYLKWRATCLARGHHKLVGLEIGDRVQVKFGADDKWSAVWIGKVLEVSGGSGGKAKVIPENNRIELREGVKLDDVLGAAGGVWLDDCKMDLIETTKV